MRLSSLQIARSGRAMQGRPGVQNNASERSVDKGKQATTLQTLPGAVLSTTSAKTSDLNDSRTAVEDGQEPTHVAGIRSDDRGVVMASDPGGSDRD